MLKLRQAVLFVLISSFYSVTAFAAPNSGFLDDYSGLTRRYSRRSLPPQQD